MTNNKSGRIYNWKTNEYEWTMMRCQLDVNGNCATTKSTFMLAFHSGFFIVKLGIVAWIRRIQKDEMLKWLEPLMPCEKKHTQINISAFDGFCTIVVVVVVFVVGHHRCHLQRYEFGKITRTVVTNCNYYL